MSEDRNRQQELSDELLEQVNGGNELVKPAVNQPQKANGGGGKPRSKGQPSAPQTRGALKVL